MREEFRCARDQLTAVQVDDVELLLDAEGQRLGCPDRGGASRLSWLRRHHGLSLFAHYPPPYACAARWRLDKRALMVPGLRTQAVRCR
ncbi:hypothetical protein GCM10020369_29970 [Cryptosporangium minutisporangium]|uniref:Transposase n=1 Tax=Cryptosporangium minutisporangium TaxID=113569 RepID=A0ABP6SX33_9ACTN